MTAYRLHYLDNLRVFAMLFGILVHTCTITDFGRLEVIQTISNNFRMGTFFAISGFFGALLLSRQSAKSFLKHRMMALGIPFAVCLILLNPLTLWLIYRVHNDPAPFTQIPQIVMWSFVGNKGMSGPIIWHLHLWFLISLMIYSLTAPSVLRLIDILNGIAIRYVPMNRIPAALYPLGIALGVTALVILFRAVFMLALKPLGPPWIVLGTLQYWPFYILGLWLHGQAGAWNRVHRIDLPLIAAALLAWLATMKIAGENGPVFETIRALQHTLIICAAFFTLLWFFRTFTKGSTKLSSMLSGSIYTIYLFHFLVVYAIADAISPIPNHGSPMLFGAVAGSAFVITFALHILLIERSPTLKLLFNGKRTLRDRGKAEIPVGSSR